MPLNCIFLKIKQKTGSAGEDMEKSLHTLGGDTKWYSCYGQPYGGPSKIKNRAHMIQQGFTGSSAGKELACKAGDPGSITRFGRSPGEGIGYPPQCSWASLVAQTAKNLPTIQETWVQSLGWEEPLEEDMATHSSVLAWRIPMDRGAWWTTVPGATKSQT